MSSSLSTFPDHDAEIWIVPFFGQGHLYPCMELCKQLASRSIKSSLIISSNIASNIPSSLGQFPLVQITEIPSSPPPTLQPSSVSDPLQHHRHQHAQMAQGLQNLFSTRVAPVCAIVDVMMSWTADTFKKFGVPMIGFFTSGACSAAMEHASWKAHPEDLKPGEIRLLPGLPEEMALTESDLKRKPHGPPGGMFGSQGGAGPFPGAGPRPGFPGPPGGGPRPGFLGPPGAPGPKMMGPPRPGQQPPWVEEVAGSIAMVLNTCDELERPFIKYLADQTGKPVWGVGPLLPEQFYKSAGSLLHDREIRTNRRSNVTENEVIEWLDSKPRGSVLYISFGSEVGPNMEEYPQIANALEASNQPFIWVIQSGAGRSGPPRQLLGLSGPEGEEEGYFPRGLDSKVGKRGLIIRGWAPQLLILSHPSTGGFLTHCGWNSTVEALGRGVPFLAWPIRGDQFDNAKLVVNHLKVGYMVSDDQSKLTRKDDIIKGIEKLMGDEEMKKRAEIIGKKFANGFPASSTASLDALTDFIIRQKAV